MYIIALSRCLESVIPTHERDVILDQQVDLPPILQELQELRGLRQGEMGLVVVIDGQDSVYYLKRMLLSDQVDGGLLTTVLWGIFTKCTM